MTRSAMPSQLELIDLSTPEPRQDEGSSSTPNPPIVDLVTPEPRDGDSSKPSSPPITDLVNPGRVPVIDLSTPEPEQLVAALSVSVRALAMSQHRPPGLQLLTPDLRRFLLNQRPHPKKNLITVAMAHHCILHPERPYRQNWYYVGQRLLLKNLMANFASFWGVEVVSLYFWLYGHAIKPNDTVINVCISKIHSSLTC
jgi:hypothetical protein